MAVLQNPTARKRFVPKRRTREDGMQRVLANYMLATYPGVIFRSDGGGLPLSKAQAGMFKSMQEARGFPDFMILEPSRGYNGCFIELKYDGTVLKRPKDGKKVNAGDYKIRKKGDWYDMHIEEQAKYMSRLAKKGYFCRFAVGIDAAKQVVDWYLDRKPQQGTIF